jgi:hypothetical protein
MQKHVEHTEVEQHETNDKLREGSLAWTGKERNRHLGQCADEDAPPDQPNYTGHLVAEPFFPIPAPWVVPIGQRPVTYEHQPDTAEAEHHRNGWWFVHRWNMRPEVDRSESSPSEDTDDKRSRESTNDIQKFVIHALARTDAVVVHVTEVLFVDLFVVEMKSVAEFAVVEREGCDYAHVFNTVSLSAENFF